MSERTLIDHFEAHLGEVARTFEPLRESERRRFQVLSFEGAPFPEATTLVTAGISARTLSQPSGRAIQQELVACTYLGKNEEGLASLLDVVGRDLLGRDTALLRGEIIGPAGALVPGSNVEGFVCASPWYWPDEFSRFDGPRFSVLMVWLLPVTTPEIQFIRNEGIDAFEAHLATREVDFLDLGRASAL